MVLSRRLLTVASCLVTLLAGTTSAQVPLGPEFVVNTYTTAGQSLPAIASDSAGNFVVVWQSYDGSNAGVFARKYLASGVPVGASEFRVNAYTTGAQGKPSVASDPNGGLVVVWQSAGQDGAGQGVFGRRFDAAGTPGPEFQVNTYTTGYQGQANVAVGAAGNFVVVWSSFGQDGSDYGIFARRYDAAGVPQGSEIQANTYATGGQRHASVGMAAAGDFVVVWESVGGQDGYGYGVFARRYDAAGAPQGGEFRVNSYTTGDQYQPSVAMDKDGGFAVVWNSVGQDGSGGGVFGRRYSSSGVPQGPDFPVNSYTTNSQLLPRVAVHADGGLVVAWESYTQDGSTYGVFARAFDATGVPQGSDFQVNAFTSGYQGSPAVAAQPGARFVVSWKSYAQDGDNYGVLGRRMAEDLLFRDGFESGDLSKWSSSVTDGGDLAPSALAAMKLTTTGLQGVVDDTASLYVQDDTPGDENRYRARFYLDTNGFDPGEASGAHRTRVFLALEEAPTRRLAAIVLKRTGGLYSVQGRARLDDDTQADTGFFDIAAGVHFVEFDWKRSSFPSSQNGTFQLWIDGVPRSTLTGLNNNRSAVDFVRMGALSVKAGASGTLYWDEFESRRISYIGN